MNNLLEAPTEPPTPYKVIARSESNKSQYQVNSGSAMVRGIKATGLTNRFRVQLSCDTAWSSLLLMVAYGERIQEEITKR